MCVMGVFKTFVLFDPQKFSKECDFCAMHLHLLIVCNWELIFSKDPPVPTV